MIMTTPTTALITPTVETTNQETDGTFAVVAEHECKEPSACFPVSSRSFLFRLLAVGWDDCFVKTIRKSRSNNEGLDATRSSLHDLLIAS